MKSIDTRIALAILVLIAIAIYLSNMEFYDYSNKEIVDECLVIQNKYEELLSRDAGDSEWQELKRTSQENLAPIVTDLEETGRTSKDRYLLRQLVIYDIPRWIRSKGEGKAANKAFTILGVSLQELSITRRQRELARQRQRGMTNGGINLFDICLLVFDGLMVAGVAYMLWPKGKSEQKAGPETTSQQLELLGRKIEKNPNAAAYRGIRARLRAEMGLHEEATEDIDWLMERKQHGVDLQALYELRESLIEKIEAENENIDGK